MCAHAHACMHAFAQWMATGTPCDHFSFPNVGCYLQVLISKPNNVEVDERVALILSGDFADKLGATAKLDSADSCRQEQLPASTAAGGVQQGEDVTEKGKKGTEEGDQSARVPLLAVSAAERSPVSWAREQAELSTSPSHTLIAVDGQSASPSVAAPVSLASNGEPGQKPTSLLELANAHTQASQANRTENLPSGVARIFESLEASLSMTDSEAQEAAGPVVRERSATGPSLNKTQSQTGLSRSQSDLTHSQTLSRQADSPTNASPSSSSLSKAAVRRREDIKIETTF